MVLLGEGERTEPFPCLKIRAVADLFYFFFNPAALGKKKTVKEKLKHE